MTQLLVSVKNLEEAKIALAADVDIIDLKNPVDGALGALDAEVILQIVKYVAGRKPVSATIGNLPMEHKTITQKIQQTEKLGVDMIKVGFLNSPTAVDCIVAISQAQFKTKIVGVLFADQSPNFDLIAHFSAANFYGVMLDTQEKSTKNLFDFLPKNTIKSFVKTAKSASLFAGLAGKLSLDSFNISLNFVPNFVGVRTAVCACNVRQHTLQAEKIDFLKELLHKNNMNQI